MNDAAGSGLDATRPGVDPTRPGVQPPHANGPHLAIARAAFLAFGLHVAALTFTLALAPFGLAMLDDAARFASLQTHSGSVWLALWIAWCLADLSNVVLAITVLRATPRQADAPGGGRPRRLARYAVAGVMLAVLHNVVLELAYGLGMLRDAPKDLASFVVREGTFLRQSAGAGSVLYAMALGLLSLAVWRVLPWPRVWRRASFALWVLFGVLGLLLLGPLGDRVGLSMVLNGAALLGYIAWLGALGWTAGGRRARN